MSGRRAEHSGNFVQRPSCQAQHAPSNLSPASASSYPLAVGVVVVAANPQACRISADDQVRAVTLILPLAPIAVLQVQAVGFVPGIDDRLVAVIVEVDAEHAVIVASESHTVGSRVRPGKATQVKHSIAVAVAAIVRAAR